MNSVLKGGPFDGEGRQLKLDQFGNPPERIRILDSIQTMEDIIASSAGSEVPIAYRTYIRANQTKAGIWRYNYLQT